MGQIYNRMKMASPIWRLVRDRFAGLINIANMSRVLVAGMNPHLADDGTNTASAAVANLVIDAETVRDATQAVYTAYEAHRASTSFHAAADNTNALAAVPTPKQAMDLLNNLKAKYNAHRQLTAGGVHGGADTVNAVSAADADTKAKAITLANALRTAYEAHRVLTAGSVHGAADATNAVSVAALASTATWDLIAALADNLRAKYEAHRQLTTNNVHGAADNTNSATVAAVSTVATRDYAAINDIKAKLNAHILLAASHPIIDQSFTVSKAGATTEATAVALTREVIEDYKNHISRARMLSAYPAIEAI